MIDLTVPGEAARMAWLKKAKLEIIITKIRGLLWEMCLHIQTVHPPYEPKRWQKLISHERKGRLVKQNTPQSSA